MFLHQKGDTVKLNPSIKEATGKQVYDALSDYVFTITDIRTDHSCENNNPNCTCDKYVELKSGMLKLVDVLHDEFRIHAIKESLQD